jgi:hypothetical protein
VDNRFRWTVRPSRRFVRRICVAETVNVEPNTQVVVPVNIALHSLRIPQADWVLEAARLSKGMYSALSMLSDCGPTMCNGIVVMNLSSRPKSISAGTLIGQAELVTARDVDLKEMEQTSRVEPSAHVQCVIDGLSKDLWDYERKGAADFIHSRAETFS